MLIRSVGSSKSHKRQIEGDGILIHRREEFKPYYVTETLLLNVMIPKTREG
jgi:hypothetical protein